MRAARPPAGDSKWRKVGNGTRKGPATPQAAPLNRRGKKRIGKFADKPGSVERCSFRQQRRAVIPLGDALPRRSSSLPGSDASHANAPLFGLAPDGVYRARSCCQSCGGLLPHRFTLACAGACAPKDTAALRRQIWPSAVCFLLHFPSPHGARPLAGILLCGARTFLHAPRYAATAWRTSRHGLYAEPAPTRCFIARRG